MKLLFALNKKTNKIYIVLSLELINTTNEKEHQNMVRYCDLTGKEFVKSHIEFNNEFRIIDNSDIAFNKLIYGNDIPEVLKFQDDEIDIEEVHAVKDHTLQKHMPFENSGKCCPACNSDNTKLTTHTSDNGIDGPGFQSWIIDEYYFCGDCGIRFNDVNKEDKSIK